MVEGDITRRLSEPERGTQGGANTAGSEHEAACPSYPSAGFTNVEYISYHICSSKTTLHKVFHNEKYPSHLLLPVVPS